jgi:hypothetical protein
MNAFIAAGIKQYLFYIAFLSYYIPVQMPLLYTYTVKDLPDLEIEICPSNGIKLVVK